MGAGLFAGTRVRNGFLCARELALAWEHGNMGAWERLREQQQERLREQQQERTSSQHWLRRACDLV